MYFEIKKNPGQQVVTDFPRVASFLSGELVEPSTIVQPIRVEGMFTAAAPPGHFEFGQIPIFSEYLVERLKAADVNNIQDFPAVIVGEDGSEWADYRAVQIVGLVRCANLDKSDYQVIAPAVDESMPPLCDFDDLVIDPDEVPADLKIFRLAEQPSRVIMSKQLVSSLLENKPEGGWGVTAKQVCD